MIWLVKQRHLLTSQYPSQSLFFPFFLDKRCLMIFWFISCSLLPRCDHVINSGRAATLLYGILLLELCMHNIEVLYYGWVWSGRYAESVRWKFQRSYALLLLLPFFCLSHCGAQSTKLNCNMTLKLGTHMLKMVVEKD